MSDDFVAAAHIQPNRVTAVCATTDGLVQAATTIPTVQSVGFEDAVIGAVERACAQAGAAPEGVRRLVVGVSCGSLRSSRVLRRVPGGRYWRDVLATALEFGLPVPAKVQAAVTLAARAEAEACRTAAIDARNLLLIHVGLEVEAALFRNGSLRHEANAVPRQQLGSPLIGRIADMVEPLIRAGAPDLAVVSGAATRTTALIRRELPAELLARGVDLPRFVPGAVRGDVVLAGGLLLAATP